MNLDFPHPIKDLVSLEPASVTNIFGAAGTGKTNLCLLLATECARKGGKVAYMDTEGGFSMERLRQMAGKEIDNIVNSIILVEPKNFEEQGERIRKIETMKVDLIILDSSVALYRLEPNKNSKVEKPPSKDYYKTDIFDHNRELSKQISILSAISRDKNIPVVLTAHTYKNWDTGENEIVGGDPMKYWSKCIIFLEKTGKTGERKATIIKHRSQPEGKSVKFEIVEEGIKPSGFRIF